MKKTAIALSVFMLFVLVGCNLSQAIQAGFATSTPQATATPIATLTPIPTSTPWPSPTPTATSTPSIKDILIANGLEYVDQETVDNRPCNVYSYDEIVLQSGQLVPGVQMSVAVFENGELRIVYQMTSSSAQDSLDLATKIIREAYGDQIANWIENHFELSTETVNTGNDVVDGHWIAVGAGQVDSSTIKIMLIISPDTSAPAGVNT